MKKSIWREKFDPTAEFVVNKPLRFGGRDFAIGEKFDVKTSERQLRTLHGARFINIKPNSTRMEKEDEKAPAVGSPIEQQDTTEQPATETDNQEGAAEPEQSTIEDPQPGTDNTQTQSESDIEDSQTSGEIEPDTNTENPPTVDETEPTTNTVTTNTPTKRHVMVSRGWYNVIDADGNVINDKKLRLKEAVELVAKG